MSAGVLTRRAFLKVSVAAGGGMLIGFHIPEALPASIQPKPSETGPHGCCACGPGTGRRQLRAGWTFPEAAEAT